MYTAVIRLITLYKLNLITPEKISIQENRVMCIKNQLCMVDVNFVIMEDIYYIHQSHRMEGRIEFINHQRPAV